MVGATPKALCPLQQSQEARDHLISLLVALGSVEVLSEADAVFAKGPITSAVLDGTRRWMEGLAVDLQDPPLPVMTDEKISLVVRLGLSSSLRVFVASRYWKSPPSVR